jgi:hypothetical protein
VDTDRDNKLGAENGQGKVKKAPCIRIKGKLTGESRYTTLRRTTRRTRGRPPPKTGEVIKAMVNRIKRDPSDRCKLRPKKD